MCRKDSCLVKRESSEEVTLKRNGSKLSGQWQNRNAQTKALSQQGPHAFQEWNNEQHH